MCLGNMNIEVGGKGHPLVRLQFVGSCQGVQRFSVCNSHVVVFVKYQLKN